MRKCYHIVEKEKYGTLFFHGFFQFSDGKDSGPIAIAETSAGHVDTFDPSLLVFIEPPAESVEPAPGK